MNVMYSMKFVNDLPCTDHYTSSELGLYFGVFSTVVVVVFTCTLAAITVCFYKSKSRQMSQIESKLYEEVDHLPLPQMETTNNVAYASCHNLGGAVSCNS